MFQKLYQVTSNIIWNGRIDDPQDIDSYRWHQLIQFIDLKNRIKKVNRLSFCFLGFKSDEGVARNLGRTGAQQGPDSIRKQLSNLPSYFNSEVDLFDAGDILCDGNLEQSQFLLAEAVYLILEAGMFPVLLGGGHEIAFGHYLGINKYLKTNFKKNPAIINVDAHFDMRPYQNGGTSGTMFHQIADTNISQNEPFKYFVLGIQQSANTKSLFKRANNFGAKYILARDIKTETLNDVFEKIDNFISDESVYLTICTDVFSSSVAPGVSSPQPFGMQPEIALQIIKHLAKSGNLISFDIAEVAPRFDDDDQTSKLASIIIFAILNTIYKPQSNLIIE